MDNKNSRGKFMRVSVELLDMIDYSKPYEMQLAMTLLYKGQALYYTWNDTLIDTTASLLFKAFKKENITRRQGENIVDALVDMRDRGLIAFDGEISLKEEVVINVKPLLDLANSGDVFVELLAEDFYEIMYSDNVIKVNGKETKAKDGYESLLLQAFLVAKARWNFVTIDYLETVDDFAYAIRTDKEVQQAKGVFCSDTLDFIRTHKHYSLEEVDVWCDDRYLMAYLEKLEELGCIKIYSRKMKVKDGMWKTKKFYYVPTMEFECIDAMVRQYARRNNFAIKEQEEETPTEPKPFAAPRGGEREAHDYTPLEDIETGCTSEANKKAHEKARARNWNKTIEQTETNGQPIEHDLTDLYIQPKCSERVNRNKKW